MPTPERLLTVKNTSDEPIIDYWDGAPYTFAPGEEVTLVFGVATHFRTKYPEIVVVEEKQGIAPHVVYSETVIQNMAAEPLDLMWDGHPYHFEPGATARLASDVAEALMTQARGKGGKLVVAGSSEPEASAVPTPHEPATPEQVRADEPPAPNPRKPRARK